MDDALPTPARLLGPAGLIPFMGLAGLALLSPDWRTPTLTMLLAYGVCIASFLGAVHWGLALRPLAGEAGAAWARMGLGVLPALLAWAAMLLLSVRGGLLAVAAIILATSVVETLAARRGLVPQAYLRLRWGLTTGAAASLLLGAAAA
ncbi:DUF3429 domain-containing protein [Roseomonas sp. WA12]